ncbi:MAG: HNH endonuclease [Pseudomonadota bacterium]
MTRSVPEWIGRTPDTPAPPRVRLRVFEAHGGTCYLTDRKIRPGDDWDLEHITALCNGGENRENNLAPALKSAHQEKTKQDVAQKAKNDRVRKKHLGIHDTKQKLPFGRRSKLKRKISGEVVER